MENNIHKAKKTTKLGLWLISIQFVLGLVVGLWHKPPMASASPALANLAFNLHIIVAVLLLIVSFVLVFRSKRINPKVHKTSCKALIAIILAIFGASFIFWLHSMVVWGLFLMGIGFLGTASNYIKEYIYLDRMK